MNLLNKIHINIQLQSKYICVKLLIHIYAKILYNLGSLFERVALLLLGLQFVVFMAFWHL